MTGIGERRVEAAVRLHDETRILLSDGSEGGDGERFTLISRLEVELALHFAGYECERCGAEEALTLHHCVNRAQRGAMGFGKYARMRHDFRNMAILCVSCHNLVEGRKDVPESHLVIPPEKVVKVKQRFTM